jgi:hypothetical protein
LIKENQIQRRNALDSEMLRLCYQRMVLQRQLEEIEKQIRMKEGAVAENEAFRKDISTDEAIQKAKEPEKPKEA